MDSNFQQIYHGEHVNAFLQTEPAEVKDFSDPRDNADIPLNVGDAEDLDFILYFHVHGGLEARNVIQNHLDKFAFSWRESTGGQAAFSDGDFGLFSNEVRRAAMDNDIDIKFLARMPNPGIGLMMSDDMINLMISDGVITFPSGAVFEPNPNPNIIVGFEYGELHFDGIKRKEQKLKREKRAKKSRKDYDEDEVEEEGEGEEYEEEYDDEEEKAARKKAKKAATGTATGQRREGEGTSKNFETIVVALTLYKQKYHNLKIPYKFVVPMAGQHGCDEWPQDLWGLKLGARLKSIRRENNFANHREELEELGIEFEALKHYKGFDKLAAALKLYKQINGDLVIPYCYSVPAGDPRWEEDMVGMKLGMRIYDIRYRGTFKEHKQELIDIGVDFDADNRHADVGKRGKAKKRENKLLDEDEF